MVISPSMAPRFLAELTPHVSQRSASAQDERDLLDSSENHLTLREQEILQLVARGLSNAEIAETLVLSENTVKTHIKNILGKLHSKNRSEAVAYASRLGFLRR